MKGLILLAVIALFSINIVACQATPQSLEITLTPEDLIMDHVSLEDIGRLTSLREKSIDELDDDGQLLWKHTKRLMKAPSSQKELKTCLQKAYVYYGISKAALTLGKYSLFEYPAEQKREKNSKKATFCADFMSSNSKLVNEFKQLQLLDSAEAADGFGRDFNKALFYFHKAERLLNADAPVYIMFLLHMNLYTENLSSSIQINFKNTQKILVKLYSAASMRGSKLATRFLLNELLHCMSLEANDDTVIIDMLEDTMIDRLRVLLTEQSERKGLLDLVSQVKEKKSTESWVKFFYKIEDQTEDWGELGEEVIAQLEARIDGMSREESEMISQEVIKKLTMVVNVSDHFLAHSDDGSCPSCTDALTTAVAVATSELEVDQFGYYDADEADSEFTEDSEDDDGYTIDERGIGASPSQAEEILRMRAQNGELAAQVQLGNDYFQGNINNQIPQNHEQAAQLFEMAANQGNAQAMFNTGLMYANGQGVPKNGTIAKKYFDAAIEGGEEVGYAGLGFLYNQGLGVEKNLTMAAHSFQKAANAGNKDAMVNFAILTYSGYDDTKPNQKYAIHSMMTIIEESRRAQLFVAIEKLHNPSLNITCESILKYITKGDSTKKLNPFAEKMIVKKKEHATEDALMYSLFASFLGSQDAYYYAALLWKEKEKTERKAGDLQCVMDDNKLCSMLFYHRDALLHSNTSFVSVGHMFYEGSKSFQGNVTHAAKLYTASNYLPESLHSMSYIYERGHLGEKNLTKAIEINDQIFNKALAGEFPIENAFPALIRKIYLFFMSLFL